MRSASLLMVSALLFTGCVESSISFTTDGSTNTDVSLDSQTNSDAGVGSDSGCATEPPIPTCYLGGDCSLPVDPIPTMDGCGFVCPDEAAAECAASCEMADECALEFATCCESCDASRDVIVRTNDQSDLFEAYCDGLGEVCSECTTPLPSPYERFVPTCEAGACGKAPLERSCDPSLDIVSCIAVCLDGADAQAVNARVLDALLGYYDSVDCDADQYTECIGDGAVGQCEIL